MPSLKVFIASPGDVNEERDIVSNVVIPELRRIFGDEKIFGVEQTIDIEAIRWETHTWPDIGEDAQEVTNRQIGDFDILIGIMWKRFGTPTQRSDSGTREEFERAYEYYKAFKRPTIMFYFRTSPFYTTDLDELSQFQKVIEFREKLVDLGVRFSEYGSPLEFERFIREHLLRQIFQLFTLERKTQAGHFTPMQEVDETFAAKIAQRKSLKVFLSYAREDLDIVKSIYRKLQKAGFDPWLDVESLLPGQNWMAEMRTEISSSNAILVFLSKISVHKRGYFQKELQAALDEVDKLKSGDSFIIPIRLDPVKPTETLQNLHYLDYFSDGADEKLINALDAVIERVKKNKS